MLVNYSKEKFNEKSHIDDLLSKLNNEDLIIFDNFDTAVVTLVYDQRFNIKDGERIRIISDLCYDFCQSLIFKTEPIDEMVNGYLAKAEEKCNLLSKNI